MMGALILLILGTLLWPRALHRWIKLAGVGLIVILVIIMLVDSIYKTPEEARKRAVDNYVWASAEYRVSLDSATLACNDVDASGNIMFNTAKTLTGKCKEAARTQKRSEETAQNFLNAIVPPLTEEERDEAGEKAGKLAAERTARPR
ncbi:MAG: hypothetical protein L0Y50_03185 [Beijerinckiaceae bacterium]|nr:hypothetical protein [Beijerinckiaceae bacterium]